MLSFNMNRVHFITVIVVAIFAAGETFASKCNYQNDVTPCSRRSYFGDEQSTCEECNSVTNKEQCDRMSKLAICQPDQVCVTQYTRIKTGTGSVHTAYSRFCGDASNCPCKGIQGTEDCTTPDGQTQGICKSCKQHCQSFTTSSTTSTTTPSTSTTTTTPLLARSTTPDTSPKTVTPENAKECSLVCLNGGTLLRSRLVAAMVGLDANSDCCCKCPENCFGERCETCAEEQDEEEPRFDYIWLVIVLAGVFLILVALAVIYCCLKCSKCNPKNKCTYPPTFPSWPWNNWNNWWYNKPAYTSANQFETPAITAPQPYYMDEPDACMPSAPPRVMEKSCIIEKPCVVEKPTPYVVEKPCIVEKEVIIEKPYIVEKPKSYIVEKPRFVEKACEVEKPEFVEKEVIVEKPRFVETPVVVEKPKFVEKDVLVEKPYYVEKDFIVEKPHYVEKPVPVEKPHFVEKQCIVEKPQFVEKSVIVEKPKFVEKKYTVEKPCFVEKEIIVEKPCFVEKPIMLPKPVIVEKPFVVERPCIVEQPCVVEKARIVNKPLVIENACIQPSTSVYQPTTTSVYQPTTTRSYQPTSIAVSSAEPRVNSSESWYKPSTQPSYHDQTTRKVSEIAYKPSETTYKTTEALRSCEPCYKTTVEPTKDYTDGHNMDVDTESCPSEVIRRTTYYKVPQVTKKYYRMNDSLPATTVPHSHQEGAYTTTTTVPHSHQDGTYTTDRAHWDTIAATPVHTTSLMSPTVCTNGLAPGSYYSATHH